MNTGFVVHCADRIQVKYGFFFDFCGLTDVNYQQVFKVLAQDSQAGTNLSRESLQAKKVILPENFLSEIQARLSAQPIINTPDFWVPGTWQPD